MDPLDLVLRTMETGFSEVKAGIADLQKDVRVVGERTAAHEARIARLEQDRRDVFGPAPEPVPARRGLKVTGISTAVAGLFYGLVKGWGLIAQAWRHP